MGERADARRISFPARCRVAPVEEEEEKKKKLECLINLSFPPAAAEGDFLGAYVDVWDEGKCAGGIILIKASLFRKSFRGGRGG